MADARRITDYYDGVCVDKVIMYCGVNKKGEITFPLLWFDGFEY